jgi:PAS domain S-box-containing protein
MSKIRFLVWQFISFCSVRFCTFIFLMKIRKPEIFFSLLCLFVGSCWVLGTEAISQQNFSADELRKWTTYADGSFVLIVTIVLFFSIRFYRLKLTHSQNSYKTLFNTSPLPMWIFDIESGKFLLVNQAMVDKYGYSKKELMQMSPVSIRPAEEVPRYLADIQLKNEGMHDVGIWKHKKKNGNIFIVQVRTNKILYKQRECFLVIADDITELMQSKSEIERLSLVAKHTINGIIITGEHRRIEWVNDAFIKMTGYSFNEVVGENPIELLHGEETDKNVEAEMSSLISKGKSYSGEVLNYKKDGTKMWVQTTVSPVEENGAVNKYVAIFLDITERKNQESLIRHQNARLKEIAFASSHLIRAPLANILGLTSLLDETGSVANDKQIIEYLKASAQKLDLAITEMVKRSVHSSINSNN